MNCISSEDPSRILPTDWWMKARMAFRTGYRSIFDSVFALTCWLLWEERNARVFEQKFRSIEQLVQNIKEEVIVWKTAGVFTTCNSEIT
uniref:Uncharacterized protein n=2 Tax=Oryza TaxID=4527 RepID=A0A0D3G929_9ORYZ